MTMYFQYPNRFIPNTRIRATEVNSRFDEVVTAFSGVSTDVTAVSAAAQAAQAAATSAIATAQTAVSSITAAAAQAATALAAANTAQTAAASAQATATSAQSSATGAVATANAASTTASSANTKADAATATANNALTVANSSQGGSAAAAAAQALAAANAAAAGAASALSVANDALSKTNGGTVHAAVGIEGNLYVTGVLYGGPGRFSDLGTTGSISAATGMYGGSVTSNGAVLFANTDLSAPGQAFLGSYAPTLPVLQWTTGSSIRFDRAGNSQQTWVNNVLAQTQSSDTFGINTRISITNDIGSSYGGQVRYFNPAIGAGPSTRIGPGAEMQWINAAYSAATMTLDNTGGLTPAGLVYGRGGGSGLGQIHVQQGGTPSGGAVGDLWLIYP